MVVYSKLLEKFKDSLGYVIYVFELLDNEDKLREKTKYLMCTQPPNWSAATIRRYKYIIYNMCSNTLDIYIKDTDGKKFKFPDRDCKNCKRYKCLVNMDMLKCNFAKYGCRNYNPR